MEKMFLGVFVAFVLVGCSGPVTFDPPTVNHQFAKESEARRDKAMTDYFSCLKDAVRAYKSNAALLDVADAAQSKCDSYARDFERHTVAYSMALRIGHPDELSYGQAMARNQYADLVQRGRGFVIDQMLMK